MVGGIRGLTIISLSQIKRVRGRWKNIYKWFPPELEIIRQDFERRNTELVKKIEQLEEEKIHLKLDVDVPKLETRK